MRNQAATGNLASGQTDLALQTQGQGQANQLYNQYIQNLSPYFNQAQQGAAGQAGVLTGLGTGINANQNAIAGLDYGANASIGNAQANAENANSSASQNMWNAITGGISAMAGSAGGAPSAASRLGSGLSNIGSGISSLFA